MPGANTGKVMRSGQGRLNGTLIANDENNVIDLAFGDVHANRPGLRYNRITGFLEVVNGLGALTTISALSYIGGFAGSLDAVSPITIGTTGALGVGGQILIGTGIPAASGSASILIGPNITQTTGLRAVLIGENVQGGNVNETVVIGGRRLGFVAALASGIGSVVIGSGARSLSLSSCVAIGYNANVAVVAADGIAIGNNATSSGTQGVAIGSGANAGNLACAMGLGANSFGQATIAIGQTASAAEDGVSLGQNARCLSPFGGIAVGRASTCQPGDSVVVGYNGFLSFVGLSGVAIGSSVSVTGASGIAIGRQANVSHADAVAIGHLCLSTAPNRFFCGSASHPINVVRFIGNTAASLGAVYEFTNGSAQPVSGLLEARIRYNSGTNAMEVSKNGAAFVAFA